jgi:uncharacterized protein YjiS (DUF1127 family)
MKTDFSTIGTPNFWLQIPRAAPRVASFCTSCASTAFKGLANFVTNLQIGRMESVLRGMSDKELAQIGITRTEITQHAKFLVVYEDDGL